MAFSTMRSRGEPKNERYKRMMSEYGTLIERFSKEDLSAEEFADKYVKAWLAEPVGIPETLYRVLEDVFGRSAIRRGNT